MKKLDLDQFYRKASALRVIAVMVSQNGELLAKHNFDDDCRRNIYSASKSFTSAAVGIAQREGLLSISEKLTDAFPDDLPDTVSDELAAATVRDLLTMCLGQGEAHLMGGQRPFIEEKDWVKLSLSYPFTDMPGTRFLYNNVGPYLAGVLVQRRAGCDLVSYLMPRMLEPMGIRRPMWEQDPCGYTFGAGGMFLNLPELHRLGLLYLQDGNWNGRQLVPKDWVRESTSVQADNGAYGYGYLFWGGEQGSFRADGKYCQLSIILRSRNAVISLLSECRDGDALNRAIFDEIVPQL
ncbi:MAG: serine hydrolase domain-containing protein [Lachnospiraceae bacterium]|jgi:CubicO group peptidase (beta-lactamase class C family)